MSNSASLSSSVASVNEHEQHEQQEEKVVVVVVVVTVIVGQSQKQQQQQQQQQPPPPMLLADSFVREAVIPLALKHGFKQQPQRHLSNSSDLPYTVVEVRLLGSASSAACAGQAQSNNIESFQQDLFLLTQQLHYAGQVDAILQQESVFRRHKRLVVFDMDSTLIQQEVIDEIARKAGVVDQVEKITEAAMNGEIDFKESLRRRVALLKDTPASVLEHVKSKITFTPGARELCKALKKLGYVMAVISGGFIPLALYVKAELGLDYAFANQLRVSMDGSTLTGETVGPIVDGVRKAELLDVLAQTEGVTRDQIIAVGDGANDLWMLAAAGLGVAFNAKHKVQQQAKARINQPSLINILYLLGLNSVEINQLIRD